VVNRYGDKTRPHDAEGGHQILGPIGGQYGYGFSALQAMSQQAASNSLRAAIDLSMRESARLVPVETVDQGRVAGILGPINEITEIHE